VSQSPFAPDADALHEERVNLRRVWWLFLILGVVMVFVGLMAISSTFVATMASVVVFGVLLLIAGVAEVIHAVMVRNWKGFALHLFSAALYLILGLFMLEDPVRAAAVLTLLIAASFFVGGVLRIVYALVERFHAWPWVVLQGVVDLLLGGLIWSGWPETSLWVIGLFIGIDLLLHGWSWVILALTVRTYTRERPDSAAA
jgi:uncharacterized membrane protein HdeD (DUF308 family)